MRRRFRILLDGLAGLSFGFAVLVAVLWVRSYWYTDYLQVFGMQTMLQLCSSRSGASVVLTPVPAPAYALRRFDFQVTGWGTSFEPAGFHSRPYGPWTQWWVTLPHGLIVVPLLLLPAHAWWRRLRPMTDQNRRCRACGYDLRATPERCPECGAIPPTQEAQA